MATVHSLDALIRRARLAVCGDFALDAHWQLASSNERSIETQLPVRRVAEQRWELGGAARVAKHLSQLRVQRAVLVGAVGRDLFGRHLLEQLDLPSLRSGALLRRNDWSTLVYGKPESDGREAERIDFGTWTAPPEALRSLLLQHLTAAIQRSALVIFNQQVDPGLLCPTTAEAVNAAILAYPHRRYLADCRTRLGALRGVIAKCNAEEARQLLASREGDARQLARALSERYEQGAFVTAGADGMAWAYRSQSDFVVASALPAGTDPCGAGDAITAALGAALASGADHDAAARFAVAYVAERGS